MCHPAEVYWPETILARGEHAGFEFLVTRNKMGFRCGYVRLPVGHPWHGQDEGQISCEVHGGLTFAEYDEPCKKGGADDGWWIGFDAGHLGDAPDPELPGYCRLTRICAGESIKSTAYMEAECKKLCEQAAAAATCSRSV